MTIEREREHLVQAEPTMIMTSAGEVFQVAADRRGYQMLTSRKASPASPNQTIDAPARMHRMMYTA